MGPDPGKVFHTSGTRCAGAQKSRVSGLIVTFTSFKEVYDTIFGRLVRIRR